MGRFGGGSDIGAFGLLAIAVAVWEFALRGNTRRWQVWLLAFAGLGDLATQAWAIYRRGPGVDPSWPIIIGLLWLPLALPYIGFRAEEAVR